MPGYDWRCPYGTRLQTFRNSISVVLSPKYEVFCCDENGPPARREEGAYLNRDVTDSSNASRRPIFIATKYLVFRGQDTS